MLDYIEIFSLVTGVVFIIMQITQHKWMWYLQLATAISAIIVASFSHLWGSAALNLFFTVMAFLGIYRWKKMEAKMEAKSEPDRIHIARLSRKALPISFSIIFFGGSLMYFILTRPGVSDPYPFLDSITFVLSMVGSYWLTRSYIWQWLVWFILLRRCTKWLHFICDHCNRSTHAKLFLQLYYRLPSWIRIWRIRQL